MAEELRVGGMVGRLVDSWKEMVVLMGLLQLRLV